MKVQCQNLSSTGVIVDSELGLVMTNSHCIVTNESANAEAYEVHPKTSNEIAVITSWRD